MKKSKVLVLMMVATMTFAGCGNAAATEGTAVVETETVSETAEETEAVEETTEEAVAQTDAVEIGLESTYDVPEGYDEYQVMGYYFAETDETIPIMVGTDSDHTKYSLHFDFFGDEQVFEFHVEDDAPVVDYDMSGFITKDVDKMYAAISSITEWNKVGEDTAEAETQSEAPYEAPEGYDEYQVVDYYFAETDETIPMMVGTDSDHTKFNIHFDFFGDEQVLEYHIEDGTNVVDYDKSGFITKDVDKLNDAIQEADNWVAE